MYNSMFDIHIYYGMMTTIKLVNISITPHSYLCVYVVRTLKIYPLSKCKYTNKYR